MPSRVGGGENGQGSCEGPGGRVYPRPIHRDGLATPVERAEL